MERILKIVYQRNKERKLLTDNDVKKIYSILIEINKCQSIHNIAFEDRMIDEEETSGSYYWDNINKEGTIYLYKDTLLENLDKEYEMNTDGITFEGAKIDILNWYYLNVILHEFSHAKDQDAINKKKHDIGTKLIHISNKLMQIRDFYEENYEDIPVEVKARNSAKLEAYKIYNMLPEPFISITDKSLYGLFTVQELQSNYFLDRVTEVIESPTERVFQEADYYNLSKFNIDSQTFNHIVYNPNNLTLYKKLIWGFPISYEEFSHLTILQSILGQGNNIDIVKKLQRRNGIKRR